MSDPVDPIQSCAAPGYLQREKSFVAHRQEIAGLCSAFLNLLFRDRNSRSALEVLWEL